MRSLVLLSLTLLCFAVGCGSSTEVKPYEGEVTTPPALEAGSEESTPGAPGLVE